MVCACVRICVPVFAFPTQATWHGYPEVCQLLVEAGASLMAADANGQTPYMLSLCDGGDLELQKFLAACEQRQRIKEDPSETAV